MLGESQFAQKEGLAYHINCYRQLYGVRCDVCKEDCIDDYLDVGGKSIHDDCFICNVCNIPLKSKAWYEINDKFLCEDHYKHRQK